MEKYKKLVQNLFSLFSNKNVVSQLKVDTKISELAKKVINDLIYLEKNENSSYEDQKWSIIYARAFVKILNKPITYEISNGQNIEGNLDNLNEYIFTKYNVDLKQENIVVSKESLNNIVEIEKNKKIEDQTKNVDNSQTISLNSLNSNTKTINTNNQFSFGFESIKNLEPPHFNERFYPYKTKPKNIVICKKILLVIFLIYLCIFVAFIGTKIYKSLYLQDSSSKNNQTNLTIYLDILSNIFISLIIYFVFKKPTKYSEQYHIKTSNLVFLVIFVFFEILIITQTQQDKKNILAIDTKVVNKVLAYLEYALIVAYIFILIISIVMLVINPKLDRDKLMKANMYYMKKVEDLNSGRQSSVNYEDLYDSQLEYDEFKRKYFSEKSKK